MIIIIRDEEQLYRTCNCSHFLISKCNSTLFYSTCYKMQKTQTKPPSPTYKVKMKYVQMGCMMRKFYNFKFVKLAHFVPFL